jgi:hypothetical protein
MTTKHLRILCLSALLGATACGTDDSGNGKTDPGSDQLPLKDEVRAACLEAEENGSTPPACPDVWLGDGVCDDFCQGGDADDCAVCTQELRERDDVCVDGDVCDPDCIACAAIYIEPDGVCPSPDEDPCAALQDGDCIGGVVCIDIAYEKNGCCEAAPGCEDHDPEDCGVCSAEVRERDQVCNDDACDPDCQDRCNPDDGGDDVACPAYDLDGCCDAGPGCEGSDPDCQIACTAEVREPDGVCDAEYCDPDCQIACAERDEVTTTSR